jgi:acyl-CoA synthetase (AMP-forming)/AMP-acid ligase II
VSGFEVQRPYDALVRSAARHAEQPFLEVLPETAKIYDIESRSFSYRETLGRVNELKAWYQAAGIAQGDRVGLMLQNRPAFFFNWFALNALGASVVPLSTEWRATELEYVATHSEMRLAVGPREQIRGLSQWCRVADPQERSPPGPAVNPSMGVCNENIPVFDAPVGDLSRDSATSTPAHPGTECALLYTSGTTGKPKGCILPNEYFVQAGHWYATIGGLCEVREGRERMLTPLPTSHMNAMACSTMCMLMTGGCLIALDRFHASTWWKSVRESRETIVHYLGVMPAMLLGAPPSASDREHEVRFGFGAGVNPRHHADFEKRFGFPLLEAWAMTETGAGGVVIANHEPRHVGTACFGKAAPAVEYRLVDEEGKDVPTGTPGELLVRASGAQPRFGFFAGYLKDQAATEESWKGGYFHTGDVVRADAEGNLYFVDRKKNVIRRSGENISAVEVESALIRHPGVHAVGVAAVPDAVRGDEVMACIVAKEQVPTHDRRERAEEIVRFALANIAYYKVPGYVTFCDRLPLTPTEKIQRAELKQLASRSLENGSAVDTRRLKKRENVA